MKLLEFFRTSGQHVLIFGILLVLLILFLRDFNLTSKRSWAILFGFTALGGIFAFQYFRRRNLLKELEEREKALKEIEKDYEALKRQGELSEEKYLTTKAQLARAKRDAARSVLSAEEDHRKRLETIEKEHAEMTPEELVLKSFEIIKKH